MTVARVRAEMDWDEYVTWAGYKAARVQKITAMSKKKKPEHFIDW